MVGDAVSHLPREIQPLPAVLEYVHNPKALGVVTEAAGHQPIDHAFPGMAERRMPQVVAERDGFRQLLVQTQNFRDTPRNLRDLEGVRQPGAVVVAHRGEEHLGLVFQPSERFGVNDPIAVTLKRRADGILGLRPTASLRVRALRRLQREELALTRLEVFTDGGHRENRIVTGLRVRLGARAQGSRQELLDKCKCVALRV